MVRHSLRPQHAVERALLRLLGAEHAARDSRQLRVCLTREGKPHLPELPDLRVSVAHASGVVVVAACLGVDVGVDIEDPRATIPQPRRVARRLFADAEFEAMRGLRDDQVTNSLEGRIG